MSRHWLVKERAERLQAREQATRSPVHPYYDRAGLRNIAQTTRGASDKRKLEPMERRRWRWVGLLIFLCSAGMMIWLGFSMAEWFAS